MNVETLYGVVPDYWVYCKSCEAKILHSVVNRPTYTCKPCRLGLPIKPQR